MSEKSVILNLSKVICYASRNVEEPFCINGHCHQDMSDTFIREAEAVLDYMIDTKLIKKAKLL